MHLNFHLAVIKAIDLIFGTGTALRYLYTIWVSSLTSSRSRKLFICVVAFQAQVNIGDTVHITITDAVYHGTSLLDAVEFRTGRHHT